MRERIVILCFPALVMLEVAYFSMDRHQSLVFRFIIPSIFLLACVFFGWCSYRWYKPTFAFWTEAGRAALLLAISWTLALVVQFPFLISRSLGRWNGDGINSQSDSFVYAMLGSIVLSIGWLPVFLVCALLQGAVGPILSRDANRKRDRASRENKSTKED